MRSDEVRKELAGLAPAVSAAAEFGEGIYDPAVTAMVYAEMLRRAERALQLGESVIVDASWTASTPRQDARRVAHGTSSALVEIECTVPSDVAAERLRHRTETYGSDASPAIAQAMARQMDPWRDAFAIDTDRPVADVLAEACRLIRGRGSDGP